MALIIQPLKQALQKYAVTSSTLPPIPRALLETYGFQKTAGLLDWLVRTGADPKLIETALAYVTKNSAANAAKQALMPIVQKAPAAAAAAAAPVEESFLKTLGKSVLPTDKASWVWNRMPAIGPVFGEAKQVPNQSFLQGFMHPGFNGQNAAQHALRIGGGAGWGEANYRYQKKEMGDLPTPEQELRAHLVSLGTGATMGVGRLSLPTQFLSTPLANKMLRWTGAGDKEHSGSYNLMNNFSRAAATVGSLYGVSDTKTILKELGKETAGALVQKGSEYIQTPGGQAVQGKFFDASKALGKDLGNEGIDAGIAAVKEVVKPYIDRFLRRDLPAGLVGAASGYMVGSLVGGAIANSMWGDDKRLSYEERRDREIKRGRMKAVVGLVLAHVGGIGAPLAMQKYYPMKGDVAGAKA